MNRSPLNSRAVGNGVRSYGVNVTGIANMVMNNAAAFTLRAGARARQTMKISTKGVFSGKFFAKGRTTLKVSGKTNIKVFRAIYASSSNTLRLRFSVLAWRVQKASASATFSMLNQSKAGIIKQISGKTTLRLLGVAHILVGGSPAPIERTMVVSEEDRKMVA